ncbi:MAG TPA: T9SS type A sorting domain-containing protein [Patescibacteria group bacterium]|nr:T9SS type A sorting domain-containing protein [Patescibacteria group bacterium]
MKVAAIVLSIIFVRESVAQTKPVVDPTLPVQFCLIGGKVITSESGEKTLRVTPPGTLKIINLGNSINSSSLDYGPAVSADGSMLYFVSNRAGSRIGDRNQPSHDIWAARLLGARLDIHSNAFNIDTATLHGDRSINTALNEGTISISADQKTIFFSACDRSDGNGDFDIYTSQLDENGKWGEASPVRGGVNSRDWESMPSISPDGKRLYFVSNRESPKYIGYTDSLRRQLEKTTLNTFVTILLRLPNDRKEKITHIIQKIQGILSNPKATINDYRKATSVGLKKISEILSEEDVINIETRMDTAVRSTEITSILSNLNDFSTNVRNIWYSDYNETTAQWGPAKFLDGINTDKKDVAPFICADGKTLLFSSNGRADSYGKMDFYVTRMNDDGTWMEATNLGAPLNTADDDMFIAMPANSNMLYFSSKRNDIPGILGNMDIFMAYVPLECALVSQNSVESKVSTHTSEAIPTAGSANIINMNFKTQGGHVEAVIQISKASFVSLKLYDIVGQELATVVDREVTTPGEYSFPLQISHLANGAYFFRLQSGNQSITQGFAITR